MTQAVATANSVTPKQTISQRLLTASIGKNACDIVTLKLEKIKIKEKPAIWRDTNLAICRFYVQRADSIQLSEIIDLLRDQCYLYKSSSRSELNMLLDLKLSCLARGSKLISNVGERCACTSSNVGYSSDTNDNDQGQHNSVFNCGWPVFTT